MIDAARENANTGTDGLPLDGPLKEVAAFAERYRRHWD
jgi:hypothetical protein